MAAMSPHSSTHPIPLLLSYRNVIALMCVPPSISTTCATSRVGAVYVADTTGGIQTVVSRIV